MVHSFYGVPVHVPGNMNVKMYTATTGEVRRYPTYPAGNKKGEYNLLHIIYRGI